MSYISYFSIRNQFSNNFRSVSNCIVTLTILPISLSVILYCWLFNLILLLNFEIRYSPKNIDFYGISCKRCRERTTIFLKDLYLSV